VNNEATAPLIVKAEQSLFETNGVRTLTVSNPARSFSLKLDMDARLQARMGDRPLVYFYANLVPNPGKAGAHMLALGAEALPQPW
jgi:hypothetical protein